MQKRFWTLRDRKKRINKIVKHLFGVKLRSEPDCGYLFDFRVIDSGFIYFISK